MKKIIFKILIVLLLSNSFVYSQNDSLYFKDVLEHKRKAENDLAYFKVKKLLQESLDQNNNNHILEAYYLVLSIGYNNINIPWLEVDTLYNDAISYTKETDNLAYNNIYKFLYAGYLNSQNNFGEALEIFQEVEKKININKASVQFEFYNSYAHLYFKMGDIDEALVFLKKSADIIPKESNAKNLNLKSIGYNNIGILFKNNKQYDSAFHYLKKALAISIELKDTIAISKGYNNIGNTYSVQNNFDRAKFYYEKSYNINPNKPTSGLIINYSRILITEKKYTEAEILILNELPKITDKQIRIDCYDLLIDIYIKTERYKEATGLYKIRKQEFGNHINEESVKEIQRLKAKYEDEKKRSEIINLREQNERQKKVNQTIVIAATVLTILILVIFLLLIRNKNIKNRMETIQLEQQLMRSQMSPHFIFNALSNIQSKILKNENNKAISYLAKFSKLVRNILESSTHKIVSLESEIQAVKDYIDLQKMRYENPFTYEIELDENIFLEETMVPPMLFQPIVENAIEHGIKTLDKGGEIKIKFTQFEKHILCEIIDNGIGYAASQKNSKNSNKKSISTEIISKRLSIISSKIKYPLKYKIENIILDYKTEGTKVSIDIPIMNT